MEEITSLIANLGFPISCVIGLGWYIKDNTKQYREEMAKREGQLREEMFKREEQFRTERELIIRQLSEMVESNKTLLATNQNLLDANNVLTKEINAKLDRILSHAVTKEEL